MGSQKFILVALLPYSFCDSGTKPAITLRSACIFYPLSIVNCLSVETELVFVHDYSGEYKYSEVGIANKYLLS